jgi:extracellular factor (EF) 3-hydroxypalmitic acid methyl ester biosynthesis protein
MQNHLNFIQRLLANNGPDVEDYPHLEAWIAELGAQVQRGELSAENIQELRNAFGDALSPATMQGFMLAKPHGYAGDFEIIDRIYQTYLSSHSHLRKWDEFAHQSAATKAVRNRKAYFLDLLEKLAQKHPDAVEIRVLNVASGPGRDLFEFFSAHPNTSLRFECVENDPKAIAFAAGLCGEFLDRIEWHEANAFLFESENRFDLVWSAGLFDYFNDRYFKALLRQLYEMVDAGGELVIGNFSDDNSTRPYMEIVGEWFLEHRSREHLIRLAQECEIERDLIRVGEEQEGVNLFLHIQKPTGAIQ